MTASVRHVGCGGQICRTYTYIVEEGYPFTDADQPGYLDATDHRIEISRRDSGVEVTVCARCGQTWEEAPEPDDEDAELAKHGWKLGPPPDEDDEASPDTPVVEQAVVPTNATSPSSEEFARLRITDATQAMEDAFGLMKSAFAPQRIPRSQDKPTPEEVARFRVADAILMAEDAIVEMKVALAGIQEGDTAERFAESQAEQAGRSKMQWSRWFYAEGDSFAEEDIPSSYVIRESEGGWDVDDHWNDRNLFTAFTLQWAREYVAREDAERMEEQEEED